MIDKNVRSDMLFQEAQEEANRSTPRGRIADSRNAIEYLNGLRFETERAINNYKKNRENVGSGKPKHSTTYTRLHASAVVGEYPWDVYPTKAYIRNEDDLDRAEKDLMSITNRIHKARKSLRRGESAASRELSGFMSGIPTRQKARAGKKKITMLDRAVRMVRG